MEWQRALKSGQGGVILDVEVVPGSRESRFPTGFNPWRGRLEAKVRAPPQEGQANTELCSLVAAALGVPPSCVTVSSGQTSRKKGILARGLTLETARARLAKHFS